MTTFKTTAAALVLVLTAATAASANAPARSAAGHAATTHAAAARGVAGKGAAVAGHHRHARLARHVVHHRLGTKVARTPGLRRVAEAHRPGAKAGAETSVVR